MADGKNDFKVILNGVRPDAQAAVAQELSTLFPIDPSNALNIVKNAPIILIDKLMPHQARNVGVYATRLRALGADVLITGQPVGKLQVLRWPILPDIARRPSNQVICPHCGAKLQFQIQATASGGNVIHPAPGHVASVERPQAAPAVASAPAGQPAGQPAMAIEMKAAEPQEDEVVLEEVAVVLDPVSAPAPSAPVLSSPPPSAEPKPQPKIAGSGTCKVILVGKIKGERKQQASDLMVEYLGISREEALMDLNKQTVLTVAKDLSESDAEECKRRFAEIGVKVNVKT